MGVLFYGAGKSVMCPLAFLLWMLGSIFYLQDHHFIHDVVLDDELLEVAYAFLCFTCKLLL